MMKKYGIGRIGWLAAALCIALGLTTGVFAQGKGKGKGGGKSDASRGNSDKSKKTDDPLWNGFPDRRDERGRGNSDASKSGGAQRFKGLSKKTGVSAETLRARFEYERRLNGDLTYGQFVAAHMIARSHRGIAAGDILGGLRDGRSIGRTLSGKGWDKKRIDKERKRIRDQYKTDDEFADRDDDWLF